MKTEPVKFGEDRLTLLKKNINNLGRKVFDSPRAGGKYYFESLPDMKSFNEDVKVRLTSWLIEQRQLGVEYPAITTKVIEDAEQRKALSVSERADRLLKYIRENTTSIGQPFFFDSSINSRTCMNMLAWSESANQKDLQFLINEFLERGWLIEVIPGDYRPRYHLTMEGYAHLDELENKVVNSSQAFVAMWLDESMKDMWEKGIELGIRDSGYKPLRIDRKEHSNKIDDEIIAEIRRSRFVVADFTHGEKGVRGGVYYEAGFAHGLNIPVIFTCRKDALEQIHFDTRQYNHIAWKEPEDLRRDLAIRIAAVIGDGPSRNSDG